MKAAPKTMGLWPLVWKMGLEPIRIVAQEPKSCTSTNSVISTNGRGNWI